MTPGEAWQRQQINEREPQAELHGRLDQGKGEGRRRVRKQGQQHWPYQSQGQRAQQGRRRRRHDYERQADSAWAQLRRVDGDRLDPTDREEHGGDAAENVEMRKRIERETSVVARSRVAQCDSGPSDDRAMHGGNEKESKEPQNELLRREVEDRKRHGCYFFKLIACCVSRSAGSSLSPGA